MCSSDLQTAQRSEKTVRIRTRTRIRTKRCVNPRRHRVRREMRKSTLTPTISVPQREMTRPSRLLWSHRQLLLARKVSVGESVGRDMPLRVDDDLRRVRCPSVTQLGHQRPTHSTPSISPPSHPAMPRRKTPQPIRLAEPPSISLGVCPHHTDDARAWAISSSPILLLPWGFSTTNSPFAPTGRWVRRIILRGRGH